MDLLTWISTPEGTFAAELATVLTLYGGVAAYAIYDLARVF